VVSDEPFDMIFIPMRTKEDGTVVAGHWRRQKPALTDEQKRDKQRLALVERAKKLQAAREAVEGTEYQWLSDEELLGETDA